MITYYHTASYIYAVANGYCGAVFDASQQMLDDNPLIASPVAGAVIGNEYGTIVPIEEVGKRPDGVCRLCFQLGDTVLLTDFILRTESHASTSVRPSMRPQQSTIPDGVRSRNILRIPFLRPFPETSEE